MESPLTGIKIIDLTTVLMGPSATQILGDMGADVVKIEPLKGDVIRYSNHGRNHGMSNLFLNNNRNKRSLVLNLKEEQAKSILLQLVKTADVFVCNVRPQAMQRLGLTYEDLRKVNPQIIYVACFGFGQNGPHAERAAYDDLIQAMIGIPHLFARAYQQAPTFLPVNFCDRVTGLKAVNAVTTALFYRERTGKGQLVEIPMYETMVQFLMGDHLGGYTFDPPTGSPGYERIVNPNRIPYRTKDDYLAILVYNDKQWTQFLTLIGQPNLIGTGIFTSVKTRGAHIEEVYGFVKAKIAERTTSEWLQLLADSDIPHSKIITLEALFDEVHLKAIDFFKTVEHPSEGRIRTTNIASQWSESPLSIRLPAPRLGQHSLAILRELGYTKDQIVEMVKKGVTKVEN